MTVYDIARFKTALLHEEIVYSVTAASTAKMAHDSSPVVLII